MRAFLENTIRDAVTYTEHAKVKRAVFLSRLASSLLILNPQSGWCTPADRVVEALVGDEARPGITQDVKEHASPLGRRGGVQPGVDQPRADIRAGLGEEHVSPRAEHDEDVDEVVRAVVELEHVDSTSRASCICPRLCVGSAMSHIIHIARMTCIFGGVNVSICDDDVKQHWDWVCRGELTYRLARFFE